MAYTLDTKVGDILKDVGAVKILEKHAPGVSKNPMIGMAKGMTLKVPDCHAASQRGWDY